MQVPSDWDRVRRPLYSAGTGGTGTAGDGGQFLCQDARLCCPASGLELLPEG